MARSCPDCGDDRIIEEHTQDQDAWYETDFEVECICEACGYDWKEYPNAE